MHHRPTLYEDIFCSVCVCVYVYAGVSTCLVRPALGSLSLMEDGFVLSQRACPNRRQGRLKRFPRLFNALTTADVNMI